LNIPLHFSEAFEVPRNFSRKVSCVSVWGDAPTLNFTNKKHGNAVLFYFYKNFYKYIRVKVSSSFYFFVASIGKKYYT